MAKSKVKRNFIELAAPEKYSFGQRIFASMTGDLALPVPSPPLSEIQTLNTALINSWTAYKEGGVGTKENYEAADAAWNAGYAAEADYVDSVADGDVVIITGGGWNYTDVTPTKRPAAGAIVNLRVSPNAQAGSVKIVSDPAEYADSYITIIAPIADIGTQVQITGEQFLLPILTQPVIIRPSAKATIGYNKFEQRHAILYVSFCQKHYRSRGRQPNY